jgi:hypothetical protein
MITEIKNLPSNMVGFTASGEITEDDFNNVVLPRVKQTVESNNEINYMLVLDTSIKNFTAGAWMKDAAMGFKHLFKWNRAAIVTDVEAIATFNVGFSAIMPGEFKTFKHAEEQQAIDWVSGKIKL